MILFGAAGLVVTLADTVRLFLKAGNQTLIGTVLWAVWAAALVMPFVWVRREMRSQPPRRDVAMNYLVLGYGTAVFALRVIEASLSR